MPRLSTRPPPTLKLCEPVVGADSVKLTACVFGHARVVLGADRASRIDPSCVRVCPL